MSNPKQLFKRWAQTIKERLTIWKRRLWIREPPSSDIGKSSMRICQNILPWTCSKIIKVRVLELIKFTIYFQAMTKLQARDQSRAWVLNLELNQRSSFSLLESLWNGLKQSSTKQWRIWRAHFKHLTKRILWNPVEQAPNEPAPNTRPMWQNPTRQKWGIQNIHWWLFSITPGWRSCSR